MKSISIGAKVRRRRVQAEMKGSGRRSADDLELVQL